MIPWIAWFPIARWLEEEPGRTRRGFRESVLVLRGGVGNRDQISSMAETLSSLEATDFGSELMPSARYHRMRGYYQRPAAELEEILLLQRRIMLQGGDAYDRYRDWRLDVDNMTYEELLDLGDKIGYVSTGLGEEEIAATIRKVKQSIFDTDFSTELARKCSICQEEYQMDDELGTLRCGHGYHIYCIKKWLLQKNACPVCKSIARKP
ncbi:hypothetical protein HPP92_008035 [Vanilla planifolia]|uniref:RING-type E3 ubiquitin transferase n=1 Tax=Vanilla planifolia TaxID=51239 RepID=A0A835RSD2_VANPL|nr:hypothetical protein HPP92_008035 [Vanilla planifolia]